MGYQSQREEIDYWTNSALIQEPELTQRLDAQRFGEEAMEAKVKQVLEMTQSPPINYQKDY